MEIPEPITKDDINEFVSVMRRKTTFRCGDHSDNLRYIMDDVCSALEEVFDNN